MSRTTSGLVVVALLTGGAILLAGDLIPPAGPVAPTMKTLDEVEARTPINLTNTPGDADSLYKITAPGSYYLTGNVTGVAGKHGLEIASNGVTIDLNGFDLVGVPGMGAFNGVVASQIGLASINIISGTVRGWGGYGIDFRTAAANGGRIEGVIASGNNFTGIAAGHSFVIARCASIANGLHGISNESGGVITDCAASLNVSIGVNAGPGTSILNCSSHDNSSHGIAADTGCTVTGCTSYVNGINGIAAAVGATVVGCTVSRNIGDGISAGSDCTIRGNGCYSNGLNAGNGSGIAVSGFDNHIEGNKCSDADFGIRIINGGNVVFGNTCAGNTTNWDVASGNVCLVVQSVTSGAINGNAGGVSPGSTNPWANFTY